MKRLYNTKKGLKYNLSLNFLKLKVETKKYYLLLIIKTNI